MTAPVRLQLSRARGFNLQEHSRAVNGLPAVNCARPGKWGNRWKIGDRIYDWIDDHLVDTNRVVETKAEAIACFRKQYENALASEIGDVARYLMEELDDKLRGKNLACFCKLDEPCHADVLLELANR